MNIAALRLNVNMPLQKSLEHSFHPFCLISMYNYGKVTGY